VLLECDIEYHWTCIIYEFLLLISLPFVSLPLFVCLPVCCMCDDRITCVIREQMIFQIILAWSRWKRGWGGLRSFFYIFSCLKSDTKNYVIFFWSHVIGSF